MKTCHHLARSAALTAFLFAAGTASADAGRSPAKNAPMDRVRDPNGALIVVAHRGCHSPAPYHGFGSAPENSLLALERCVQLGVDVMETDIRRTLDGHLVMIHDDSVDRTTDGTGKVADLTLVQIKSLHLRQDEGLTSGGKVTPPTDHRVPLLDEILAKAKGRIMLNLDVQAGLYPEVIDAVKRAGAQDWVIVKTSVGPGSAPAASMAPYDEVPFMVIPRSVDGDGRDIPATIAAQVKGKVRPVGIELPYTPAAALPAIAKAAREAGVRVWSNTLWDGFAIGAGGDREALRMPQDVWGKLWAQGISMIQTDEPEALLRFRLTLPKR